MPDPEFGICWGCQKAITAKSAVWLDGDSSIQCCRTCWRKIPVERRIEIAMRFMDRSDRGLGVEETLSMIRDLIHSANDGYFNRRMDTDEGRLN